MLCGASLLDFWLSLRIRYGFVRLLLYAGAVFAGGGFAAVILEIFFCGAFGRAFLTSESAIMPDFRRV